MAALQETLAVEEAEELDACGHESRPAGLMAGPQSGAVVTVKILVEEQVITPMGIRLERFGSPVHGPATACIAKEDAREPIIDLAGHLEEGPHLPGTGGAFHPKLVAVSEGFLLRRLQ